MAYLLNNDIYENTISGSGGGLTESTDLFASSNTLTILLGVVVSLIPKIIPRALPYLTYDKEFQDKSDDPEYMLELEEAFRIKFVNNLELLESLLVGWKGAVGGFYNSEKVDRNDEDGQNSLDNSATFFQDQLLGGIRFLKERVENLSRKSDRISQITDVVWNWSTILYSMVYGA